MFLSYFLCEIINKFSVVSKCTIQITFNNNCFYCVSSSTVASQTTPTVPLKKKPVDDSSTALATGDNNNPDRFCSICQASFNNPLMAQQHYVGKKHRKQMTKLKLMETYGPSTAPGQTTEPGNHEIVFVELPSSPSNAQFSLIPCGQI